MGQYSDEYKNIVIISLESDFAVTTKTMTSLENSEFSDPFNDPIKESLMVSNYSESRELERVPYIQKDLIVWAIVDGILLLIILFGNILTILAVRYSRRLRSVISNHFVLSLAISDILGKFDFSIKFTVLHQLVITLLVLKNSANQNKDTKILFSDWLYQFLLRNFCKRDPIYKNFYVKIETANQKIEFSCLCSD
jgi:hypothetical protein